MSPPFTWQCKRCGNFMPEGATVERVPAYSTIDYICGRCAAEVRQEERLKHDQGTGQTGSSPGTAGSAPGPSKGSAADGGASTTGKGDGEKDALLRENKLLSSRVGQLEAEVDELKNELKHYKTRVDTWTIEFASPQVPRRARGQLSELIQKYTELSDHQVSQMFRSWGQRPSNEPVQLELRASRDAADHLSTEMQRITTIPLRVVPVSAH